MAMAYRPAALYSHTHVDRRTYGDGKPPSGALREIATRRHALLELFPVTQCWRIGGRTGAITGHPRPVHRTRTFYIVLCDTDEFKKYAVMAATAPLLA